ncbi:beta-lactamase family protein [bacterium]|nr:beta-lactamase family protein [candidate division CSSED10-310 bacterium]
MLFDGVIQRIADWCDQGVTPSAVAGICQHGESHVFCAGRRFPGDSSSTVTPDTLFDIASVTKPVATTTLVLQIMETGGWTLDTPIASILPECNADTAKQAITLHHLLTHTSGLPAWQPLYLLAASPATLVESIAGIPLESPPGTRVTYSCLGFLLLGEAIRRFTGETLSTVAANRIFWPLEMHDTQFNPPKSLRFRIAPTELGNAYERTLSGDAGRDNADWRRNRLHGEVHDGNAHFMHGEGGNAGLFSTVPDLIRFGRCMLALGRLNSTGILSMETVRLATMNHTTGLGSHRGLGWQMADSAGSAGTKFSPSAYGHTGFTGTSLWIDPEQDLVVVLLTNRAYFGGSGDQFGRERASFHDAIISAVTG